MKLSLSKKQWESIGTKTGWIKQAQQLGEDVQLDSGDFVESWNETSRFLVALQNKVSEGKRSIDDATTKEEVDEVISHIEYIGERINTWVLSAKRGL
jgi:beta-lactamase class D